MCKRCAELHKIYLKGQKEYWDEIYVEGAGIEPSKAWDNYYKQAMKHVHHKEEQ